MVESTPLAMREQASRVLVVRGRRSLDCHQQPDRLPDRAARLPSQELEGIGILLLRHQRGSRAVGICQGDEAELGGGVENQVLGEAAEVDHDHAAGKQVLEDEVSIAHLEQVSGAGSFGQ
eukprot:755494-Hanusia_phi.AAC.4